MDAGLQTVPVFYEDFYRRELEVWVDALEVDERFGPCLVLSETLCHPHGGGQKGDRATLVLTDEELRLLGTAEPADAPGEKDGAGENGERGLAIVDTRKADGRILHVLENDPDRPLELERAGEVLVGSRPFRLKLDWEFRHNQMRLHSAAHLLHCFVERVLGRSVAHPETSDIQPSYGLNRYDRKELLTAGQMEAVLESLNAFTAEGHPIKTYPDPEKAGFRYWQCGEWVIPCGGTHPADTREIGPVTADLSLKRGRTGITFRVEGP